MVPNGLIQSTTKDFPHSNCTIVMANKTPKTIPREFSSVELIFSLKLFDN